MAIYIDFDRDFNNYVLDKINTIIENTGDNKKVIINIDSLKRFEKEINYFIDLGIINEDTNELYEKKYQIFRKFIRSETIDGIEADKIKRLIDTLREKRIDYKRVLRIVDKLGLQFPYGEYDFHNNNELQIWALIMLHGEKLYRSLSNEGIYFDKQSGEVFKDGVKLGSINIHTQEMRFFEILYDNIGQYKTHEEIIEYIKERKRYSVSKNFLSNIKRNLKEPIKILISAKTGAYIIKKS